MNEPKTYYRRHLPHYQPAGESYHVIFRLAGSIPANLMEELRSQREAEKKRIAATKSESEKTKLLQQHRWKYFERIEKLLDSNNRGPFWLRKPEIAAIVEEAMHYYDEKEYLLIAYSIMPNHVHRLFKLLTRDSNCKSLRRDEVPSNSNVRRVSDPTAGGQDGIHSYRVTDLVGSIKKYSGLRANRVLGRHGAFWHDESYDHVIRDVAELERTIEYVLMNPVKAGLCKDWREWKCSYIREGYFGD